MYIILMHRHLYFFVLFFFRYTHTKHNRYFLQITLSTFQKKYISIVSLASLITHKGGILKYLEIEHIDDKINAI